MYSITKSAASVGIKSYFVNVEVDIGTGLPCYELVGLLSGEVREAKERVRVALKNVGIEIPPMKITISLAPGDLRKEGTAFDLPIAVGMMTSLGMLMQEQTEGVLFLGELGLNGELRSIKGALPIAAAVVEEKEIHTIVLPSANAKEAAIMQDIRIVGAEDILQVLYYLQAEAKERDGQISPTIVDVDALFKDEAESDGDYAEIHGQRQVKRAAEIAAAGFHHMLMVGPPGSGKTMIAKRLPSILPPLSLEESIEVSKIYSVAGLLNEEKSLVTRRPFLNPHHTISVQALAGGGRVPKPGLISLAHRGVLFLDELPEFSRSTIEIMRQPLEDKEVCIARSQGSVTYPAGHMLIAAMNPCPCGFYPDRSRCRCTPNEIRRYLSRISGPILDRIDITVEAPRVEMADLQSDTREEDSATIRERIMAARERQLCRYKGRNIHFNAELGAGDIQEFCHLGGSEQSYAEQIFDALHLSARSYHRILRLARTIADLAGSEAIMEEHLSEAVCYKMTERLWENLISE